MNKRTLGPDGPEVSAIGLGCMGMSAFYGATDEPEALRTIHRALELGCNFLDTSDMYGPHTNERLVGRRDRRRAATRSSWRRSSASSSSPARRAGRRSARSTAAPTTCAAPARARCERLGVEHIDLYYQHRVDPNTPIEETVGAMAELVAGGQGAPPRPLGGERRDDPPRARGAPDHRGAERVLAVDARRRGGDPADARGARHRARRLLAARPRLPLRALHLARGARRGRLPPLRAALHRREPASTT